MKDVDGLLIRARLEIEPCHFILLYKPNLHQFIIKEDCIHAPIVVVVILVPACNTIINCTKGIDTSAAGGSGNLIYNNHFINSPSSSSSSPHSSNNISSNNQPKGKLKHQHKHSLGGHKAKPNLDLPDQLAVHWKGFGLVYAEGILKDLE